MNIVILDIAGLVIGTAWVTTPMPKVIRVNGNIALQSRKTEWIYKVVPVVDVYPK